MARSRDAVLRLTAIRPGTDSVVVRSTLGPPRRDRIIAEITEPAGEGDGMYARRRRTGVFRTIEMPVFDRFVPERKEALPEAYLIPERMSQVVELLRRQGVAVERRRGAAARRGPIAGVRRTSSYRGGRSLGALQG